MATKQSKVEKDPFLNKVPPHSIEAEQSLISAILIDNNTLLDVIEIVSPEDFYRTAHQKIFSAMVELSKRNEPVDMITLVNILEKRKQLEEIGGASYLTSLLETIPLAVNAPHYAKIIYDKACLRRLIEQSGAIVKKVFDNPGDVNDVIDYAERAIFDVSKNKIRASFTHISELIDKNMYALEERQGNKSLITGVTTGFTELNSLTAGLQKSDLVILAARPSMGKTAFALNIARNAALSAKIPVAIFSLEMSKEQLSMRLLCAEARVDSFRLRGGFLSKDDWSRITDAASVLQEAPIYIDDTPDVSSMEIRAKSRRLKMTHNLGLVIIDYIQLMRSTQAAERRDLEISEMSRSLKALAKELDIPVIAISQLNRKLEERSDKRPLLSDLRESGALEQDADVVMFIYRDEVYNRDENNPNKGKAEIIIAKQRNGPIGVVNLAFINAYTRFENLEYHMA